MLLQLLLVFFTCQNLYFIYDENVTAHVPCKT